MALAIGILLPASVARASDTIEGPNYARVRHVHGVLTSTSTGAGPADTLGPNRPIPPGTRLQSADGRAEITLADASTLWVDRDSVVEFRTLADRRNLHERTNVLALRRGRLRIDSVDPEQADAVFQIDTEAGSIYLLSAGSFRVEAAGGVTSLASFGGVAEFSGDAGSVLVRSGESSAVPAGGAPAAPRRFNTARVDDFDRYHDGRLLAYLDPAEPIDASGGVAEGLPREVVADLSELSFYGSWHVLPTYGTVWRPHVPAGWAPFVHGSWKWFPAGWVWIAAEPWGWAPYRYGRWERSPALGWFWMPGTIWSGAWVAFAVGPAQVGWCPLNYWNQPIFRDPWFVAPTTVAPGRLDPRGWRFVATGQFGDPAGAVLPARAARPPANSSVVLTRMLPRFDPGAIGRRADGAAALPELVRRNLVPLSAPGPGEKTAPFQVEEARLRQSEQRTASQRAATPARPPREAGVRVVTPPATAPSCAPTGSRTRGNPSGDAVERLVDGARSTPPDRAPMAPSGAPRTGAPSPATPDAPARDAAASSTTDPRRKPGTKKTPAPAPVDAPRAPEEPDTPGR